MNEEKSLNGSKSFLVPDYLRIFLILAMVAGCGPDSGQTHDHAYPHKPENYKVAVQRLKEIHEGLIGQNLPPKPRIFQAVCDHQDDVGHSCLQYAEVLETESWVAELPTLEISIGTEWYDLVRWLPYIAADSNLPKSVWDRINGLANQLMQFSAKIPHSDDRLFQQNYLTHADQLLTIYAELESMFDDYDHWHHKHPF